MVTRQGKVTGTTPLQNGDLLVEVLRDGDKCTWFGKLSESPGFTPIVGSRVKFEDPSKWIPGPSGAPMLTGPLVNLRPEAQA